MVQQLDLHIGVEKTGTTAVQHALAANRDRLAAAGVLYPTALGRTNHTDLAAIGRGPDAPATPLHPGAGTASPGGSHDLLHDRADALRAELDAARPSRLLLSNEHCSSRLVHPHQVERLWAWLLEVTGAVEARVVVYLRRQDALLDSHYSTQLRAGGLEELLPPTPGLIRRLCDHEAMLRRWSAVVGQDAVMVRRYHRPSLVGGGIVTDFAAALDLPELAPPTDPAPNTGLGGAQQLLLLALNRTVARRVLGLGPDEPYPDVVAPAERLRIRRGVEPMLKVLERLPDGSAPARLPAGVRAELLTAMEPGNSWIARTWFGGQPLHPDESATAAPGPTTGDVAALAADLAVQLRTADG